MVTFPHSYDFNTCLTNHCHEILLCAPKSHVLVYTVCFVVVLCLGCLCRRALMNEVTVALWLLCYTMLHNAVANEQPQCDLLWS